MAVKFSKKPSLQPLPRGSSMHDNINASMENIEWQICRGNFLEEFVENLVENF